MPNIFRRGRPTKLKLGTQRRSTKTRISDRRRDLQCQRSRSQGHVTRLTGVARWRYQYYNFTTALHCHSLLIRWRYWQQQRCGFALYEYILVVRIFKYFKIWIHCCAFTFVIRARNLRRIYIMVNDLRKVQSYWISADWPWLARKTSYMRLKCSTLVDGDISFLINA